MLRLPFLLALTLALTAPAAEKPNIVVILCDDLGYGDVRCYNPAGKIPTPHFDRVAREGLRFTDAHTTSSVCTPTRYSLLTGRYNWRSRLQSGVLGGLSPRLIEPGRLTVAGLLKAHGYTTACVGKWHLGLGWARQPGKAVAELNIESPQQNWNVDYAQPFTDGPLALGFDRYFGISASLDMVPYTFLENDRVAVVPTVEKAFPMHEGRGEGQTRRGPAAPDFDARDVLPAFTKKAVEFIADGAKSGRPFFLYVPLASPHTPIVPRAEWSGQSGLNPYADFVMETDAALGEILAALERSGVAENTLLLVTSDNGCSPQAKIEELAKLGHAVSGPLRGYKADLWEGGHRVPFLVRWPARVKPGVSGQLVSLVDWLATCAEIVGAKLPDEAGEDSVSLLPILLGKDAPVRDTLVHHSITGRFAIREGNWKLCLAPGSGGWTTPRDPAAQKQGLPAEQLYDLAADLGETSNLAPAQPEVVARLLARLEKIVAEGRSTPGAPQKNAVEVKLRKTIPTPNP
jgi:arylsulfatase A-like enzyme